MPLLQDLENRGTRKSYKNSIRPVGATTTNRKVYVILALEVYVKRGTIRETFLLVWSVEFASVKTKEIREFLRATEMLLSLLRKAEDGQVPRHELLMIQTYIASLKTHLHQVENTEAVQRVKAGAAGE